MNTTTAVLPAPVPDAQESPARPGRPGLGGLAVLASLVINFGAPLLAYKLLRPHTDSSALALAIGDAIPVVYTLAVLAFRRRLDPLGATSVALFGLGVLLSWASGGSTLALDLQDPVVTGLIGLACLGSVAIGRPLHPVILRWLGRGNQKYADIAARTAAKTPAQHTTSMVTTAVIGAAFAGHAVAVAALALTQSASTFVALQQPVGLPFFGLAIAFLFLYRSRLQARQAHEATPVTRTAPAPSTSPTTEATTATEAITATDDPGEQP